MTREPGGRNNAFKHGAFSQYLIWSDENSEDFELLLQGLIEELSPIGVLEEDTVFSIAKNIWLKRRGETFYYREATWAEHHPGEKEINRVDKIVNLISRGEATDVVTYKDEDDLALPEAYRKWIEQECPRSKFDDARSWIKTVKKKLDELMYEHDSAITEEVGSAEFLGEKAALLRDLTVKNISLDERLDAGIDKGFKRLAQLKTYKQIIEANVSQKSNEPCRISDQQQQTKTDGVVQNT
jgi:hypothetical protein